MSKTSTLGMVTVLAVAVVFLIHQARELWFTNHDDKFQEAMLRIQIAETTKQCEDFKRALQKYKKHSTAAKKFLNDYYQEKSARYNALCPHDPLGSPSKDGRSGIFLWLTSVR